MSALTDRIDPYTMSGHRQRVRPAKRSPRERFRLALRLLREYERDEANETTAEEAYAVIHAFAEKIKEGEWSRQPMTGLERWRAAVERHAAQFTQEKEARP